MQRKLYLHHQGCNAIFIAIVIFLKHASSQEAHDGRKVAYRNTAPELDV